MGRRRQAREFALQALYLIDTGRMSGHEALLIVAAGSKLDPASEAFARELVLGAESCLKELDKQLQSLAANWELKRMATVDRNILRLASYEILHRPETPPSVAIDEALEIAKHLSAPESSKFINGILDKVKFHRPAHKLAPGEDQTKGSA